MDTTTTKMNYLSMTGIDLAEENRLGIELINKEIGTIDTEIDTLTTNLATEIADRTTADTNLANDLSFETASRVAQDSILSTSIGEVEAGLATEISDRTAADTTLQTNITTVSNSLTTETTNRTTADTNLQSQIDDVEDDLATETTARVAEDAILLSSIGDVEDDLATEITNRTNADITLQANINSINTTINGMVDNFSNQTIAGTKTFDSGNETYLQLKCNSQSGQTTYQSTLNLLEDKNYVHEYSNYGGYMRYYEGSFNGTNELQIGTREGTTTYDAITIPRGNTAITMERDTNINGQLKITGEGGAILDLVGSTHAYIEYFPDGTSAGRKAYVGFSNGPTEDFTIANQYAGKNVIISPNLKVFGNADIDGDLEANTIDANSLVHSPYVSLGTTLRPTVGGNWNTIRHNTFHGSLGPNYPRPEGGILLANTSGSNMFLWNYYMGVVKDLASTNSTSLRLDFGRALNIQSQVSVFGYADENETR